MSYTMSTGVEFGLFHPYCVFVLLCYFLEQAQPFPQDVGRRVLVPADGDPAIALQDPVPQVFHFRVQRPAAAADLAAGEPLADFDEIFIPVRQLIFQHGQEHPVPIVKGCFSIAKTLV